MERSRNKEAIQPNNSEKVRAEQSSNVRPNYSGFRGVQKIKDKETYVAHVYDNGHLPDEARTIYLGRFNNEEKAARAYDLVSLKFWGDTAVTNFPVSEYEKEIESMANMSDHDVMLAVRRSSNSFSKGTSKYRGVVGHSPSGKWQARKGPGKDSFLGTYDTEEDAAIAFDVASIKKKGLKAVTNFDLSNYNLRVILERDLQEEGDLMINDGSSSYKSQNRSKKRLANLQQYLAKKPENGLVITSPNSSRSVNTLVTPIAARFEEGSAMMPFLTETMMTITSSGEGNSRFNHSSSSPFQYYKTTDQPYNDQPVTGEETNLFAPHSEYWHPNLCPSYETSLFQDGQHSNDIGRGFQHASSSLFQPFPKLGDI